MRKRIGKLTPKERFIGSQMCRPNSRLNVCDGLGENPAMAVKVLRAVLPLAITVVDWFCEDQGAGLPRSLAVLSRTLDTDLHGGGMVRPYIALGDREAALASAHLDGVVCDPQPNREAKCISQPLRRLSRIGIAEDGDHRTGRNGTVRAHKDLAEETAFRLAIQRISS
jgi:hypothetical protein